MTGLDDLAAAARSTAAGRTDAGPGPRRVEQLPPAPPASDAIKPRIGLVLSGGGAKGAYHVGVVECLASAGVHIDAVAGASIGALNGAVLACAGNLEQGAVALRTIWDEVAAYGAVPERRVGVADGLGVSVEETTLEQLRLLLPRLTGQIVRPSYLEGLVATHVDPGRLDGGTPLWVSAFPALEGLDVLHDWGWALDVLRSRLGTRAEWLHVNALPPEERQPAVLASAALPVILPARRVDGRLFRDGGIADNTPVGALAHREQCDIVIVVHLTDGVLWDTHDFPGIGVIEIRPSRPLHMSGPLGGMTALVDFSPARLHSLRELGNRDATWILEALGAQVSAVWGTRSAEQSMLDAVARLESATETD
ncbi:patatin-like phospholipase family protein [Streptomyces sp. LARHCF252]